MGEFRTQNLGLDARITCLEGGIHWVLRFHADQDQDCLELLCEFLCALLKLTLENWGLWHPLEYLDMHFSLRPS